MQAKLTKCTYCLQRLLDSYIHCADCDGVHLCFACFASGAEGGVHVKSHKYTVEPIKHALAFSLFGSDDPWSFDEELKLVEAIETYGYGNWTEVALQLGRRTANECKQHYELFYINGTVGNHTWKPSAHFMGCTVDHTLENEEQANFDRSDFHNDLFNRLGYMPYRDEFEYEYLNNAEKILSCVPLGSTDQLENELQLALIGVYNQHLLKRRLCHTVAREHGLVTHLLCDLRMSSRQRQAKRRALTRKGHYWPTSCKRKRKRGRMPIARRLKVPMILKNEADLTQSSGLNPLTARPHEQLPINPSGLSTVNPVEAIDSDGHSLKCSSQPAAGRWGSTSLLHQSVVDSLGVTHVAFRGRTKSSTPDGSAERGAPLCLCPNPCTSNASTTTSDSGICSADSCAQSTISNGSTTGDSLSHCTVNTTICPSFAKRSRSNSDSVFIANKKPPDCSTRLSNSFQKSSAEETLCSADVDKLVSLNAPSNQPHPLVSPNDQPVIKRRRGRPPRSSYPTFHARKSISSSNPGGRSKLVASQTPYPPWMTAFLRFMTGSEAQKLAANLLRESKLRTEIDLLADQHRRGVRLMQDVHNQSLLDPKTPVSLVSSALLNRRTVVPVKRPVIAIRRNAATRSEKVKLMKRTRTNCASRKPACVSSVSRKRRPANNGRLRESRRRMRRAI